MFQSNTPTRAGRSYNRDQPNYAAGSRSPVSRDNNHDRFQATQRPQTAAVNGQREPSSSKSQTGGYVFQPYSSPYVGGKKNNTFVNPNLVSSNVFYDHSYGYKGDLPNDRLLSPVQNDRYNRRRQHETVNNHEDRAPLTPPKSKRVDVSEDRFTRSQGIGPRKLETVDDHQSRKAQQRSVDSRMPREQEQVRRNSGISNQEDQVGRTRVNRPQVEDNVRSLGQQVEAVGGGRRDRNETYSIRDDRSEASTVISTLSSDGYVCPNCLNRHMASGHKVSCMAAKREDQERERRIQDMNKQLYDEDQAKKRNDRARKVEDSKNLKEKLENEYNSRLESRRSPAREKTGNNLNNLFGKQDEMRERQRAVNEMFRSQLKDQIRNKDEDKEREKKAGSQLYNTSLNIGTDYHNRYIDDPESVRYKLQEQIEEKNHKQQREKEKDKRAALALHEEAMRNLDQEDRYKRDKQWSQRKELQDAYWQTSEVKRAKDREARDATEAEKMRVDHDYNEYKRRQHEEEAKTKSRLFDFKQGLLNQMGQSSYKKMYEERRQQKEATSFDPKGRTKKKYPCGDCSDLYEKPYLTKLQ